MSTLTQDRVFTLELGDESLIIKNGALANQANASVVCQMGDTVSLVNCTVSTKEREGVDFLPLQVIYQEKYYAGGHIAGSRFRKREGRPSDDYVLLGRIIDRGLRPMFPKHLHRDIQVFCTVLSYDFIHEHDIASANAANLAVAISDCPSDGPLGSVRVGLIGGELVLNPSREAREKSDLDMFVTASLERVVMIEAGANQIAESEVLRAIEFGKKWAQKIARFFADIQKEIGRPKFVLADAFMHEEAYEYLKEWALPTIRDAIKKPMAKNVRRAIFTDLMQKADEKLKEKYGNGEGLGVAAPIIEELAKTVPAAAKDRYGVEAGEELKLLFKHGAIFIDKIVKEEVRRLVLEEGIRMSSRKVDEIRPLSAIIDILPNRVHGSALFERGETQSLTTCTLGGPGDKQIVEGMEGEHKLRYLHHYNFPPFSVGETSNRLAVGNREIGHGNLAQKALLPVLPKEEEFPYTIRIVTEILSSNGSSSMAATCGSTLALMAAGVPIASPVAGVALGLMSDEKKGKYVILTDLQDEEDFGGDMDFKVGGTEKGITAIQMDIKIKGLPDQVFVEALERTRQARIKVLEMMSKVIAEPRKEMSPYAPRIETIQIDPEDIRLVIGKGGEMIQKITGELGVEIDIEDSGLIFVTSINGEAMQKAKTWIAGIVEKPEVGKVYKGKVIRIIAGVGAIVEFLPGKDGMIHISELQWSRTEQVEDVLKMGQEVEAKVIEYDAAEGKTRLSLKQMTAPPEGFVPHRPSGGGFGGRPGGGRSPGGRPPFRR